MHTHDPNKQISFIQQALSQNRKPIAFLVGAGCPLAIRVKRENGGAVVDEPLIWDVSGLTRIIASRLKGQDERSPSSWDKVVKIIQEDGGAESNIELILSKIRLLHGVAGRGEVRGMEAKELEKLDNDICNIISEEVDRNLPNRDTPYHNLAIWARSIRREHPIHLFTTNYDLLVEQALEESSAPYFDGFVGARRAFFDLGAVEDERSLPARWTRLWKIHGSLNWRLVDGKAVVRSDSKTDQQSYLIYPSHLKYDQSRKMPYLAMLDRLKAFLLNSSAVMFVCGYSFADEHINDIICRSLDANPTAHVFAFLHGKLNDAKYELARTCASNTPNLSMLGFDEAIVGRNSGKWKTDDVSTLSLPHGILSKNDDEVLVKLGDFAAFGSLLRSLSGVEDETHGV